MDRPIPLAEGIYWVGVNDRETDVFESIWPLPRGVSYNAYLIVDEKVALIDTVKGAYFDTFLERVKSVLGGRSVDYLITNHMEPDHSGAMRMLRDVFPDVRLVGNKKTLDFIRGYYGFEDNTQEVGEGDTLDLGRAKLSFSLIPMVHWPETMVTYDATTRTLFAGDAFGSFGALESGLFDDEVDLEALEYEMLRYYSNIVGKYGAMVQRALKKLGGLDIATIGPTHGPVWRRDLQWVIERYDRWSRQETEPGLVVAYASMYGNTKKMAEAVAAGAGEAGLKAVRVHDVARTDASYILADAWRYRAVALASPTYNATLFPPMANLLRILKNKNMQNRLLGVLGCHTWASAAAKALKTLADESGWELVEPVIDARCSPTEADLAACRELGAKLAAAQV